MKKLWFLSVIFILLFISFVSATGIVNINSVNSPNGKPGDTVQVNIKVENTDTESSIISTVTLESTVLTLGSNNITTPSINSITNLVNGTTNNQTVSFSLTIPITLKGTYTGIITAKEAGNEANNSNTFIYTVIVDSFFALNAVEDSVILIGEEGETDTGTVIITNKGSENLALDSSKFSYNTAAFSDGENNITLSFSGFDSTLSPGASDTVTITADISRNVDVGVYSGLVNVTSGSATDIFTAEVRVQPEVCGDGIIGNLNVNIEEPGNGDDFKPGETIEVEVGVENDHDKSLDVIVEAFLYNINEDKEIERVESDSIEIGDGDDETFDLILKIPFDDDVNEDDNYKLFAKAYEDGDEDKHCDEDSVDINIERERHDVIIKDITLSPSTVKCGETVSATVDVLNIGSSNEDVTVRVKELILGWDEVSPEFELDDGESRDNDAAKRFSFVIPSDAVEKEYSIEAIVTFDDGDEEGSEFATLNVGDCGAVTVTGEEVSLLIDVNNIETDEGSLSIPVTVTNNGSGQREFNLGIINIDSWAEPVSEQVLTLNAGQGSTVYFYLTVKESVTGMQSGAINVKSGDNVLASETFSVQLGEKGEEKEGIGERLSGVFSNNTIFWIIGDVVLIIIAIFFIRMIFVRKR